MGRKEQEIRGHMDAIKNALKHTRTLIDSSTALSDIAKESLMRDKNLTPEKVDEFMKAEGMAEQAAAKMKDLRQKYGDITRK